MGSLALVILELRKAPKGYEDECGFHAVHRVRWGTLSPVQDKECSRSRIILPSGNQKRFERDPSNGKRFVVPADEKLNCVCGT